MNREEFLEKEIKRHDHLYWTIDDEEISDEEYDTLVKELRSINPNNSILFKIHTPTVNSSGDIKHIIPMLSLDKVYSVEELINWAGKVKRNNDERLLIQNKFDGWSVEKNLKLLSTRGDGFTGDNISNKLAYIKLMDNSSIADIKYVHGELVMLKSDFDKNKTKL